MVGSVVTDYILLFSIQCVLNVAEDEAGAAVVSEDWGSYLVLLLSLAVPSHDAPAAHISALVKKIFQTVDKSRSLFSSLLLKL